MSSKRKATGAAAGAANSPASKRMKLQVSIKAAEKETPESTTRVGLEFMGQIKEARDKRGHLIATHFLTLPNRVGIAKTPELMQRFWLTATSHQKEIPEYYRRVKVPVALDTIEGKLNRHEYPTMVPVESDFKRLVSNAKSFNERNSDLFSDAEKIRKMVSATMPQINPAYRIAGYVSFPTPIPEDAGLKQETEESLGKPEDVVADGKLDPDHEEAPVKPTLSPTTVRPSSNSAPNNQRASSTPAVQEAEDAGESFDGNTFQQAQEKLMTEMIQLTNDKGQIISGPFLNLPSRQLVDYYRVIKHPVCLKGAQKLVRGIKGREKPTGVSFFKSWQAFEDEIDYIWNNTREYNEEGSDICQLAGQVEAYFKRRLAEAKRAVVEPSQPKVKLRMPTREIDQPKIKLHIGGPKTPGLSSTSSTGVSVDTEALQRQRDLVNAGANGQSVVSKEAAPRPGPRNPFGGSHSASLSTPIPTLKTTSLDTNRAPSITSPSANGVKSEAQVGQSPALGAVQPTRESSDSNERHSPQLVASLMPPPSGPAPRVPSGSPHPQATTVPNSSSHHHNQHHAFDSRWRKPGKDASDYLMSNLEISTHPGLKIDQRFHLDIPPSSTSTQQSVTINLPHTHYFLRIIPTAAPDLVQRQSRLFVTLGMQRLNPKVLIPDDVDPRRPLYETRIMPGINRIEVEMVAGPPRGAPKSGQGQEIESEKIIVFVNLMRQ